MERKWQIKKKGAKLSVYHFSLAAISKDCEAVKVDNKAAFKSSRYL